MQLFLVPFEQPIPFGISALAVIVMIGIMLRAAVSTEGGSRWVRRVTNPNGKYLFGFLFVLWASSSGSPCSSCPTRAPVRPTARWG